MAVVNSSDDDYAAEPDAKQPSDLKATFKVSKKDKFTIFDFLLMFLFAALVVAMMYLKYHEEKFSKEKFKIEVTIKVIACDNGSLKRIG